MRSYLLHITFLKLIVNRTTTNPEKTFESLINGMGEWWDGTHKGESLSVDWFLSIALGELEFQWLVGNVGGTDSVAHRAVIVLYFVLAENLWSENRDRQCCKTGALDGQPMSLPLTVKWPIPLLQTADRCMYDGHTRTASSRIDGCLSATVRRSSAIVREWILMVPGSNFPCSTKRSVGKSHESAKIENEIEFPLARNRKAFFAMLTPLGTL